MPQTDQPSSTVTSRDVLRTDAISAGRSSGRSVRRLSTSAEMPSFSSAAAASSAVPTERLNVAMVTSVPARSIFALPMGMRKSLDCASGDSLKDVPYLRGAEGGGAAAVRARRRRRVQ